MRTIRIPVDSSVSDQGSRQDDLNDRDEPDLQELIRRFLQ